MRPLPHGLVPRVERRPAMLVLAAVVGCSQPIVATDAGGREDAPIGLDAPAPLDAPTLPDVPALPDAPPCTVEDGFDGSSLAPEWALGVGMLPTYTVGGGVLQIGDAAFATPSGESWIDDLSTDAGNTLVRAAPFGTSDFRLAATVSWSSTAAQVTLGAIAVADAAGLVAMAGLFDGSSTGPGNLVGQIRATAADARSLDPVGATGAAELAIERTDGIVRILRDGVELVSGVATADITHVAIVTVHYRNASGSGYTFGSFSIAELSACP